MVSEVEWNKKLLESPNPFGENVAKSVWENYPDVESINGSITNTVLNLISEVKDSSSKMMVIQGQAGIGKTHFISRLRRIAKPNNYLFVAVSPIPSRTSIFSHIYRQIFISLRTPIVNEKFTEMEKLISYILSSSLVKILKEKRRTAELQQKYDLIDKLEADPTIILNMIKSESSVVGFLKEISELCIRNIEREYPSVDIRFLTVLFKTLDKDLQVYAIRWLQGIDLDDDVLEKLGVNTSIANEDIAQSVLYSIFILTDKPLLLCFDQLESLKTRFDDPSVIISFFDYLVAICNDTPNTLILLMALNTTWQNDISNLLLSSTRDRISAEENLLNPNSDELVQIIQKRLEKIWNLYPFAPELKTYPFSPNYINQVGESFGKNPRIVLNQLKFQYQKMKDSNTFTLLDNFELKEGVSPPDATLDDFVDSQIKKIISIYNADPDSGSYVSRENHIQEGLLDFFHGLRDNKIPINDLIIEKVTFKSKDKEIDIILKLKDNNNGSTYLGVEICNNENGRSFNSIVRMIEKSLKERIIDKFIIIRDVDLPIKTTWKASISLLNVLSSSGFLELIEEEDNTTIYACKRILDLASSGDLELNNKTVTRKEILNYILASIIPNIAIINRIFLGKEQPKVDLPPPTVKIIDPDKIKTQLISLTNKKMMVIVNKLFSDFNERKDYYKNIVNEMVSESKLLIMIETDKKLVVSKPPSEKIL